MAVFQDDVANAETVLDPPHGTTTVTGNFASFTPTDTLPPINGDAFVVAVASATKGDTGNTITVARPTGTQHGDTLIAFVTVDSGSMTSAAVDNNGYTNSWSKIGGGEADNDVSMMVFMKIAASDDPSSFIFDAESGTPQMTAAIIAVRHADGELVYGGAGSEAAGISSTSFTLPSMYAPRDGSILIAAVGGSVAGSGWTSSDMTEIVDTRSPAWTNLGVYTKTATLQTDVVGATFHFTASTSMTVVRSYVWLAAPRPAASGYSGWVKLELSDPGQIQLNTFGSGISDTRMAIFDFAPTSIRQDLALADNDDTFLDPPGNYQSSLPESSDPTAFLSLAAGTYWIVVWPYDGPDWDTTEATATLTITRVDTPLPSPSTLAVIRYNGTNITRYVDLARASFEMNAGPLPGTAKIYILDADHSRSFATGAEVTLDIDGLRVWGGYVVGVRRGYAFPAQDTTHDTTVPRYWILECSDYNILFTKRFVVKKDTPATFGTKYAAGTHDDVIIGDLISDYLYLEDDGLASTGIQHVGTPLEDTAGRVITPSDSWGDAMRKIALMPGAIFYIDADKVINYADVDIEDAPFILSDQPNQTTSFGYSHLELLEDGTNLANDVIVWGAALGVDTMTYARAQDADSIAAHGLWQWADYRQDLYKPASVLKRATTYLDGSVQNNRGHKDDAISIRCTIRKPGLRAGMKVHFIANAHGYDDVIPIRSMRIRFANPNQALYDFFLAHFLDEAWNTAEFRNLPVGTDTQPPKKPDTIRVCATVPVTCGITDTFTRSVSGGVGTSDAAIDWVVTSQTGSSTVGVDGARADIFIPGGPVTSQTTMQLGTGTGDQRNFIDQTRTLRFQLLNWTHTASDLTTTARWIGIDIPGSVMANLVIGDTATGATGRIRWTFGATDGTLIPNAFWNDGTIYIWTIARVGSVMRTSITDGTTTYSTDLAYSPSTVRCILSVGLDQISPYTPSNKHFYVLDIDMPEFKVCTASVSGAITPGSSSASTTDGVPLSIVSEGTSTVLLTGSSATVYGGSVSSDIQEILYSGVNATVAPDTYDKNAGSTLFGNKGDAHGIGYQEFRTVLTYTVPAGVHYARVRGIIVAGTGIFAGSGTSGASTFTLGWQLAYTVWDNVSGTGADGWNPTGQVIAEGIDGNVPTNESTRDHLYASGSFDKVVSVTPGSTLQIEAVMTTDEGVWYDPSPKVFHTTTIDPLDDGTAVSSQGGFEVFKQMGSTAPIGPADIVTFYTDATGVVPITCTAFDTFTRSVAVGWGTSDSGIPWIYNHDTGSPVFAQTYTSGLDGGWPGTAMVGAMGPSSGYTGYTNGSYMHTAEGAGGPWVESEWTMTVKFAWEVYANPTVIAIVTGGNSLGLQIGGTEIILDQIVDDTNQTHPIAFTHDTPYYMKLHYKANTTLEAKVWAVSDAEPVSYQVSGTPTHQTTGNSYLYVTTPTVVSTDTLENSFEIDEIVFCGPDSAATVTVCYDTTDSTQVCETPVASGSCTDTFGRTVATGLGTSEFYGNPTWSSTSIGTNTGSVSGGQAHLPAAPFSGVDYNSYIVNGPASGDTIEYLVTFSVTGDDHTDKWGGGIVFGPAAWEPGPGTQGIELILGWGGAGSNHLTAQLNAGSLLSAGWSPFGTTDVRGQMLKTRIRLEQTDPTHALFSAKIWTAGGSEPSGWDMTRTKTFSGGAPTVPSMTKIQAFQYAISPYTSEMIIDSVEVTAGCSGTSGGYTVSQAYAPGSLIVTSAASDTTGGGSTDGWSTVFYDDFATWDDTQYDVYPTSFHDSSGNGTYDPAIFSSDGTKLRLHIHTDGGGSHRVGAFIPLLPGGANKTAMRATYRLRADSMHGYKAAPLLWPQDGDWPRNGEVDFPEGNFDGHLSAFMHRQDATSGGDQAWFGTPSGTNFQDWHTYTIEWVAGTSCAFYIDGVMIGSTTSRVPATPMHLVMQFETNLDGYEPDDSVEGYVEIDWLRVETPGTGATIAGGGVSLAVTETDPSTGKFSVASGTPTKACYTSLTSIVTSPVTLGAGGPVYRPQHVRQLGWGTSLDGSNCMMASACIALDRHTMGAKTATPPQMRAAQLDQVGGTSLDDADYAWNNGFSEDLDVHSGVSWSSFATQIGLKRGAILPGLYSQVPDAYSSQPSFDGPHAVYINEFNSSGQALIYDPLATGPRWWPVSVVLAYATAFTGTANVDVGYTQITS